MYDYTLLEERLSRLLKSLEDLFSTSESSEVQQFLDAGEYGLALETICGIITEERKKVGGEVIVQVQDIRDMMELESDIATEFLNAMRSSRE